MERGEEGREAGLQREQRLLWAWLRLWCTADWDCALHRALLVVLSVFSRRSNKRGVILLAHAGDAFEHNAEDVHAVVKVDEIHRGYDEQSQSQIGSVTSGASQACDGRTREEVWERPLIALCQTSFRGRCSAKEMTSDTRPVFSTT